ncbi:MAG: DNA-binding protein WhiA [Ruminococcaceae bacterium]|nr:DNA-binding protein WhiA [Oscillospiraceae bacterium]
MSFSNQVKNEICDAYKMPESCKASLLYGLLCSARIYNENEIEFLSECKEVCIYFSKLLGRLYRYNVDVSRFSENKMQIKELYQVKITDKIACKTICDSFNCGKYSQDIGLISLDEAITWAFIKGIFLGCGSVSDPATDYHLEFTFKEKNHAVFSENMLSSLGFLPKRTMRRDNHIVYFKDSSSIEDILTGMGAIKKSLELMDSKVIKDLRNRINRRNNCETANLKKTIDVAFKQVSAINFIVAKRGMDFLPEDLQSIARFRLDNPEMSLSTMAKELSGEFSKSGIDRRLKKIVQIAEELNQSKGK